jgi:serine/alanine adding enzyme
LCRPAGHRPDGQNPTGGLTCKYIQFVDTATGYEACAVVKYGLSILGVLCISFLVWRPASHPSVLFPALGVLAVVSLVGVATRVRKPFACTVILITCAGGFGAPNESIRSTAGQTQQSIAWFGGSPYGAFEQPRGADPDGLALRRAHGPGGLTRARRRKCGLTVEALDAEDRRWDELVDASAAADVYYRPGYCRAYEAAGHGRAVAVVTDAAMFPLLLRPLPFGEEGFDAATPYGYGGVLPRGRDTSMTGTVPVSELRQLRDWCVAAGVVSCLLRLHPLLWSPVQLSGMNTADEDLEVRAHGPTTAIDLSRLEGDRLKGMSKGRKSDLTIARRELEVSWGGVGTLEQFRGVYDGTMQRLGAGGFYRFPPEYYRTLADGLGDRLGVAIAFLEGEPVGGALFLAGDRIAHYHLSGTTDAGRELRAGTLLVHAGAEWARERGCELLHLGGGTAGADSLFAFKKSFGGQTYTYAFATLTADRERYDALVSRRAADPEPPRPDFFPAYRA